MTDPSESTPSDRADGTSSRSSTFGARAGQDAARDRLGGGAVVTDGLDTRIRSDSGLLGWSAHRLPGRRAFGYLAFLFVLYPVVTLLAAGSHPVESVLAIAATGMFLVLIYIGSRIAPNDRRRESWVGPVAVLAIDAIGMVLTVYARENWLAFFYYAATGASPLQPPRRSSTLILISGAAAAVTVGLRGAQPPDAILQGFSVTVIGLLVLSANETRRTNRALVEARHELARLAVAEERNRIARDLHDTLGHTLSLITLKSELAGRLLPDDPDRARTEIADVERVAREALGSVRETVSGYRKPTLEAELAAARAALAAADMTVDADAPPPDLPPAIDAVLAWTVREGVTNVVRHSHARNVSIRIARRAGRAEAEIEDDGPADAAAEVPHTAGASGPNGASTGLVGLHERVAALGGEFEAGRTRRGFLLRVELPLEIGS